MEPYNADVRAGLGTSLLIQGIFNSDTNEISPADSQASLLALATYHLKVASSLYSSSNVEARSKDNIATDLSPALSRMIESNGDNNAASHAAALHNLALAYLAVGDTDSSVPVLLRSAALYRDHSIKGKLYWNAPSDVLQAAEEKAMLIAAKPRISEPNERKKRRIPFLPFHRED